MATLPDTAAARERQGVLSRTARDFGYILLNVTLPTDAPWWMLRARDDETEVVAKFVTLDEVEAWLRGLTGLTT